MKFKVGDIVTLRSDSEFNYPSSKKKGSNNPIGINGSVNFISEGPFFNNSELE